MSDESKKNINIELSTFFSGMAKLYKPKVIPGLNAVIQFNLDEEKYYLTISGDKCKADKGTYPKPNLTIISPKDTWIKISMGEIDGTKAFMKKMFKYEGDMNLLIKMSQLFSAEAITKEEVEETQKIMKEFEHVPDHRGPLKISGMKWFTLIFIPWYILWTWGTIAWQDLLPRIIAALIALIIIIYHIITNRPTVFEVASTIYLIVSAYLYYIGVLFFIGYQLSINYIIMGAIWLSSMMQRFSLTAQYSKYSFPKEIWGTPEFLETNRKITGVWGLYFLYVSILNLIIIAYNPLPQYQWLILVVFFAGVIALVPMFAFTAWFQKWYPIKIAERRNK